jgi:hypothetical protein
MQIEDWQWREEQKKVFYNNMQAQYDKELDAIKEKLIQDLKLKDKGTMRNINNYRMKLWCDMFIEYKKGGHDRQTSASSASKDLQMFDLQFNL